MKANGASLMDKDQLVRIRAYDILWRARDAEFMLLESYELARLVQELDEKIDQGETKHLRARHHYARLSSCLWESALVKICTCWSQPKSKKYSIIVHGKKPALIIDDTQNQEIKRSIWRLRRARNEVAHPDVNTQKITNLSIQLTGSGNPPRQMPTNFAVVKERKAPSPDIARSLGRLIEYTIVEANRLFRG